MRHLLSSVALLALSGCTFTGQIQMMPRDAGKIYAGIVQGNGSTGSIVITIEGETYTGPIVRTTSSDSFGFFSQYGSRGVTSTGVVATSGDTHGVKGILASPNGRGLRCEFSSTGVSGGGICVDDKSRVYDAVVSR